MTKDKSKILGAVLSIVLGGISAHVHHNDSHAMPSGKIRRDSTSLLGNSLQSTLEGVPIPILDLEVAIADFEIWKAKTDRIASIASRFRLFASETGAQQSVIRGFEIFSRARIPVPIRDAAIECVVISVFNERKPTESEMSEIISKSGQFFGPLVRGMAFSLTTGKSCLQRYRELSALVKGGQIDVSSAMEKLILNAAIQAVGKIDLAGLLEISKETAQLGKKGEMLSLIAKSVAVSDQSLAINFIAGSVGNDAKQFANLVLNIDLSNDAMRGLTASLSPELLNRFTQEYLASAPYDAQFAVDLSAVLPPTALNVDVRLALADRLLRASADKMMKWLGPISSAERTAIVEALMKPEGFIGIDTRQWLIAASQCEGISQKAFGKAIRDAAFRTSVENVFPFLDKLTPDTRAKSELHLYSVGLAQLKDKSADSMLGYIQSKPAELQTGLYTALGKELGKSSLKDALELRQKATDPNLKRAIEDGLLQIFDLPPDTYWEIFSGRLDSEKSLTAASPHLHHYVTKLLLTDSDKALKFAQDLPESPLRDNVFKSLATQWANVNPETASEWIVQMKPGSSRDVAISELTKASKDEPESAFTNIAAISSEEMRMKSAIGIVDWWKTKDPKKVGAIIAASSLSAVEKEALQQRLSK